MRHSRFLLLPVCALMLSACDVPGFNWVPDGYYWNDDTPLSSPPQTYDWYDRSYDEAGESLRVNLEATVRGIAADMVDVFSRRNPPNGRPVYLYPKAKVNELNNIFDSALRKQLRARGYLLANAPKGSAKMAYYASPAEDVELHDLEYPATSLKEVGYVEGRPAYLFSMTQRDDAGDVQIQEIRIQPFLPKEDTKGWNPPYHDYERPGPMRRKPSYERD